MPEYNPDSYDLAERPPRVCDRCGLYDTEARVHIMIPGVPNALVHAGCVPETVDTSEGQLANVVNAIGDLTGTERAEAVLAAARENTES